MDQVPAHFHDKDRIPERNVRPDPTTIDVPPTGQAEEGAETTYLNGNDIRRYKMVDGKWRYTPLVALLSGSATYDPPSLADGAGTTTTITVTGAALGDFVSHYSFSLDLQGITLTAWVSSANTVSVRFQNESGGTLDLASGTLKVRVVPQDQI